MTTGKALIIGDLYTLSRDQETYLESEGIEISHVQESDAPSLLLQETYDAIIAGVLFNGPDLSDAIRQIHRIDPELPIILVADEVRIHDAYVLGENLVYDCVPRIVDNGWLAHKLKLAIMQRQLLLENRALSLSSTDNTPSASEASAPAERETEEFANGELYQTSEKKVILEALTETRWNRRKAARLLGISYNTLRRRIDRYHLNSGAPV